MDDPVAETSNDGRSSSGGAEVDYPLGSQSTEIGLVDERRLSSAASKVVHKALKKAIKDIPPASAPPENQNTEVEQRNEGSDLATIIADEVVDGPPPVVEDFTEAVDDDPPTEGDIPIQNIGNAVIPLEDSDEPTWDFKVTEPRDSNVPAHDEFPMADTDFLTPVDEADTINVLVPPSEMPRPSVAFGLEGSSTQVLCPVHQFPEESEARIPASSSFVENHTQPIESVLPGGLEIHRNKSDSHINIIHVKPAVGDELPMPLSSIAVGVVGDPVLMERLLDIAAGAEIERVNDNQNADAFYVAGGEGIFASPSRPPPSENEMELRTMIEEMAAAVATDTVAFPSLAIFEEVSVQFSNVAQASGMSGFSFTASGNAETRSHRSSGGRSRNATNAKQQTVGSEPAAPLPPDVKQHILETLSDIRAQLDSIRQQLRDQGMLK